MEFNLANFMHFSDVYCCKWPNIKEISWPSGHTVSFQNWAFSLKFTKCFGNTCSENTHLQCTGKYHCTSDLLFYRCGFSSFAYVELAICLLLWSNPNQSNRRSAVQKCFLLWSQYSLTCCNLVCGCGPIERVVTANIRGPRFESTH